MASPTDRATFKDYCFRALGSPVINIDVEASQADDRIDEAIQFYRNFHVDAVKTTYLKHTLTQTDIDNEYITLPNANLIPAIKRILPLGGHIGSSYQLNNPVYQTYNNDMWDMQYMGDLTTIYLTKAWLEMLDLVVSPSDVHFDYNKHEGKVYMFDLWSKAKADETFLVFECERFVDPSDSASMWNDDFLKRYATALIKRQWGTNLSKFEGIQMPGGVTFNGRQILDDAKEEIAVLTEEARLVWEDPVDFFIG